jgi:hypothetical protein
METFRIAGSVEDMGHYGLGVDFGAPLPLGHFPAIRRAAQMRNANPTVFSYATIAEVMAIYHGLRRSEGWWRRELLATGLVERKPKSGGELRNAQKAAREEFARRRALRSVS